MPHTCPKKIKSIAKSKITEKKRKKMLHNKSWMWVLSFIEKMDAACPYHLCYGAHLYDGTIKIFKKINGSSHEDLTSVCTRVSTFLFFPIISLGIWMLFSGNFSLLIEILIVSLNLFLICSYTCKTHTNTLKLQIITLKSPVISWKENIKK